MVRFLVSLLVTLFCLSSLIRAGECFSLLALAPLALPGIRTSRIPLRESRQPGQGKGEGEEEQDAPYRNVDPYTNQPIVTWEMLQRELLKDPEVLVKKKQQGKNKATTSGSLSSYKVLDNRDSLPFRVEHVTPDPYTHPEIKRKLAKKVKRRPGGVEESVAGTTTTSSRLYIDKGGDADNTNTLIGDFMLDKLTTTGDLLEIGNIQYRVTRHRCQYKYVGGKRFVMVRKILQVKEVGRLMQEEYLTRQWERSSNL